MSALHITNGDHAADKLRSVVDGPVALACDVLHEGPCPPVDGDAWHEIRARFLAGPDRPADEVRASLAADDRMIAQAVARGNAIALWFEHDLFDQLALIRTLDLIARLEPDTTEASRVATPASVVRRAQVVSGSSRTSVSLICIDRFPGVDRFIGLGQLTVDQLSTLVGTGVPVTRGHVALATEAWRAFRSPDPLELMRIALQLDASRVASSEGGAALPFLGAALLRFLAEYPSVANGLSRTEQLALHELLAGPAADGALFAATQAHEARPFLGDLPFFDMLRRLASARVPLVTYDGGLVTITDAGREVMAGRADHVSLNGLDLWRGGVHLTGSDRSPWRWDASDETLVS